MRIPISWLKEYVSSLPAVPELAHRLTLAGVEVGAVIQVGDDWEGCTVGQVLQCEPHPNADRLSLCTVDDGTQQFRVVCGAPNVASGQKIAFAHVGAKLRDSETAKLETLKTAKIRGESSQGMICSKRELGIGNDHTGIFVLPEDAPVGVPLVDYLGENVLDLEVTANRPDCLSMLGVAYEVGAMMGDRVMEPDLSYEADGDPIGDQATVHVEDNSLCSRYTASLISHITVGPSPEWMQNRLISCGMRPINNVVDVTNYVMLEYGQPLHAFDFETLRGKMVIVRQARAGETLVSLDGMDHKLSPPMLVIADERDPVGMAGIIGGSNSEVSAETTSILLESASFDPINTRRTATALGTRTEASLRFEKGSRPELPPIALHRATRLIQQLAGGTVSRGIIDIYPDNPGTKEVTLTMARIEKVLGMKLSEGTVIDALTSLGFQTASKAENTLNIRIPPWRADISIEEDLVEEVARVIGYDQIPVASLSTPIPSYQPEPNRKLKEQLQNLLAASGFQETISYSMVSYESLVRSGSWDEQTQSQPLRIANPLSLEHEWARTTLRPSLLMTLKNNWRIQDGPIRLFEIGRVYEPQHSDLPFEREIAAGILMGPRESISWLSKGDTVNFFDGKGIIEGLLDHLGVLGSYEPHDEAFFQPGTAIRILSSDQHIGTMGEISLHILDRFDIDASPVIFFELDLPSLLIKLPQNVRRYQTLSHYPGAPRDLAILLPLDVPAARVQAIVEKQPLVTAVKLFDVYTGPQVPEDVRSLAYRVVFQSAERTLTATEVAHAMDRMLAELQREVGAIQR